MMSSVENSCSVCGGKEFSETPLLLWRELIDEWQLSQFEVNYINAQQGKICLNCGSNIRSIALARSILSFLGTDICLRDALKTGLTARVNLLEINEAGTLTGHLRYFQNYRFGKYPEIDMHKLPFENCSFDLVVHSDTLEHIRNPIHALGECYRVLKYKGALCFTVPIIKDRLSRDREGLAPSYHGGPQDNREDYVVHTEFGSDVWAYVLEAGFSRVEIFSFMYPAGLALMAIKD